MDGIVKKLQALLAGKPIVSPIPQNEVLNTPGLRNYVSENQGRQQAASSSSSPRAMQYSPNILPHGILGAILDMFNSGNGGVPEGQYGGGRPANISPNMPGLSSGSPVQAARSTPTPTPRSVLSATATPTPQPSAVADAISRAYQQYNPNAPLATLSAQLADAGQGWPDPYLAAIVGMKESSGGVHQTYPNNPLNILQPGRYDYPTIQSNINGGPGDERYSFKELIDTAPYADYLKSGNVADFFKHYTPDHDKYGNRNSNPLIADQVSWYNDQRNKYFPTKVARR